MFCAQVCCLFIFIFSHFSPLCSAVFIRLNLFSVPQVVDIRARSSESQSDSWMKEIRQVLTKQVLLPAFASLLESGCRNGCVHEIMRPWSSVQVIFLLYVPWGRSHSCWCFVACESEFTEWQPAAEELKINLLMAKGGSSPCWHFVLQHARRARECRSFGSGNLGNPNLRLEYTNVTFAQFCLSRFAVCWSELPKANLQILGSQNWQISPRPDIELILKPIVLIYYVSPNNKYIFCMSLSCSEQLESLVVRNIQPPQYPFTQSG